MKQLLDKKELCFSKTGMTPNEFKKQYGCEFSSDIVILKSFEFKAMQQRIDELEKARDEQSRQLSDRESRISEYLSLIGSIRKENAELKQVIAINGVLTCGPLLKQCRQSLAQHNKEVRVNVLAALRDSIQSKGLIRSPQGLATIQAITNAINKIISEQLQEQE